jgi:hypothetical protein
MVLMRRGAALALLALAALPACSENEFEYSGEAMILPATLFEGLPLADATAREWAENAHVVRLGGGFTVMDSLGRARNHTYHYNARIGFSSRKLTVNVIGGIPWTAETFVQSIDPPFVGFEHFLDSDAAVAEALRRADELNAGHPTGDSIPIPEIFAARLASVAVWPEPRPPESPDSVAWRIDFLEEDIFDPTGVPVYWSTARFYVQPRTGEMLGSVVPPTGREIYPWP